MNLVLIIVGIAIAVGIFINPRFGLVLMAIFIPISTQQTLGSSFLGLFTMVTPIKIIGLLTFISTLIHCGGRKGVWDFIKKPQVRFFLFFLIWIFISGFTQPGFATRENFTMFVSNAILGIIILILIQKLKQFRLILWITVITMFFICFKVVLSSAGVGRAGGTGYGPNEFAIMTLPYIAISLYMILSENKKILKLVLLGIAAAILFALLSTVSRGGIIGLAGMFLIATIKSKNKILTIILVCIAVAVFFNTMPSPLRERFEKTRIGTKAYGSGESDVDSTTRRYYLAQAAWKMFLAHPLFGVGVGNYYFENRWYAPVYPGRAHNMHLEMMAELGIIGIFLFFGTIFFTFKCLNKIIKNYPPFGGYAKGLYIGLVGFLVAGIFLHAQQDRNLWFIIFMSVALERIYEKNKIQSNN